MSLVKMVFSRINFLICCSTFLIKRYYSKNQTVAAIFFAGLFWFP
jgi:hypothetical protein